MHVLNIRSYRAWRQIDHPSTKAWIRQWLDGLSLVTHPVWAFTPFGASALQRLNDVFGPQGGRDWGKYQRKATSELTRYYLSATRDMIARYGHATTTPQTVDDISAERILTSLAGALQNSSVDLSALRILSAAAAAELLHDGVSDSELFVRVGTGVLDAAGQQEGTHQQRALACIEKFKALEKRRYICSTRLLADTGPPSKTVTTAIAKILASDDSLACLVYEIGQRWPRLVTEHIVSHSRTAFRDHRVVAGQILRALRASTRSTSLHLAADTAILIAASDLPAVIDSTSREAQWQSLARPDPSIEPAAYSEAVSNLYDDPEKSIQLLCDAFDCKLGSKWYDVVPARVQAQLSRTLLKQL